MTRPGAYAVQRLAEAHRPLLLEFLGRDQVNNQFLIRSVAARGVSGNRIAFWGAFRGARLAGVAMLMDASAGISTTELGCLPALTPHISVAENLSGEHGVTAALLALIPAERLIWSQTEHVCRLPSDRFHAAAPMGARQATAHDLDALAALYAESDSFSRRSPDEVTNYVRRQLADCRYFVVAEGDSIASAAAVTAESAGSALIVSVFTAPHYRNRGLAAAAVSAACADLLERGVLPQLLYREDNEAAGRLYARLGFHRVGRWLLARLAPAA